VPDPAQSLDRPSDEIQRLVDQAQAYPPSTFERLFEQLCRVVEDVGRAAYPRFTLEVGLAGLAEAPPAIDLQAVLEQLSRVESMVGPGGGRFAGPSGGGGRSGGGVSGGARSQGTRTSPPQPAVSQRAAPRAPDAMSAAPGGSKPPSSGERSDASSLPASPRTASPAAPQRRADVPPQANASPPGQAAPSSRAAPEGGSAGAGGSPKVDFESFVAMVRAKRPSLAATLLQVRPLAFEVGRVKLGCETAFDVAKLRERDTREDVEQLLAEFLGAPTTMEVARVNAGNDGPRTITETEEAKRAAKQAAVTQAALQHPAVKAVSGTLGAEVTKVHIQDER
ncbi:MAG: hypothetical protein AAF449_12375, partial [Myxococcota bacterium]